MSDTTSKPASTSITTTTTNTTRKEAPAPDRAVDLIVVHCTDTDNGEPLSIARLDAMHEKNDNGKWRRKAPWGDTFMPDVHYVGYHFVIAVDGAVHQTRHLNEAGVHVKGKNAHSVGISLVGRGAYTRAQWHSLRRLVADLQQHYPKAAIHGHRKFANKDCPCFDVPSWLEGMMKPLHGHVFDTLEEVLAHQAAEEQAQASLPRVDR